MYEIEIIMTKRTKKKRVSGHQKLAKYMEALWFNSAFQEAYYPIKLMPPGRKKSQAMIRLAEKYHLTFAMLDSYLRPLGDDEKPRQYKTSSTLDMVTVRDDKDANKKRDLEEIIFTNAHPVSLTISKIASREDVLEYISKRWETDIKPLLRKYEPKPPRLKVRTTAFRDFALLLESGVSVDETRRFLAKIFPEVRKMDNNAISSLVSKEKRRRPEKQKPTDTGGR